VSVIDGASPFASAYDLANVIGSYQDRNLTTFLSCPGPVWTVGRAAGTPFQINANVRYPVEVVRYPLLCVCVCVLKRLVKIHLSLCVSCCLTSLTMHILWQVHKGQTFMFTFLIVSLSI
ncbi:unnamed protein product, partial [Oncorhynchus mykiss]